jgi:threonine/homoserine/homoserine lactone efflux protein
MFELILKGIFIGLCISVPLGPIGMLCVQRTLNRGRKYGIATGLGATASDLVYTVAALFFLNSIIIGFIKEHEVFFQFSGSAIILIFGCFIFKSHPATQPKPNEITKNSLAGDFFTSFALTLSNPLILFILIALFARLEFIFESSTAILIITGMVSILIGAFLWWCALTYLVSKFRTKLDMKGLKIINRTTGSIIVLIGCIGIFSSFFQ